jgi:hypothetical protein
MEEYDNISSLSASQSDLLEQQHINSFLTEMKDKNICKEYIEQKKLQKKESFNVFTIASDLYYRENFHSDVICAFLDTAGKHGEGSTFLDVFIDLLNKDYDRHISKTNYNNSEAVREYEEVKEDGQIDILVRPVESKHCIIIENKINNACDMNRQLPRYYDKMTKEGYMIDAIVYLPLDKSKEPDKSEWSKEDTEHVRQVLCKLPAYSQDGKANLVDRWILPCTMLTNNINCIATLKQYADLVKQLNDNNMNTLTLEKFYNSLIEKKENMASAEAISDMWGSIPTYMADRLVEKFQGYNSHFIVWKYKPNFCGFRFNIKKSEYKIDIWTSIKGYSVNVFKQSGIGSMDCLEGKTILKGFSLNQEDELYNRTFEFNEESTLIDWIKQSIDEVQSLCE